MASILEAICIFCMFLVGVLFPLGMMIYMIFIFIKEEIEINRLNKVDQAIILLGIYELLYTETPNTVCIDETN